MRGHGCGGKKTESHRDAPEVATNLKETTIFLGNATADRLAEEAAKRCAPDAATVRRIQFCTSLANRVQARLVAIAIDVAEKDPHERHARPKMPRGIQLSGAFATTSHAIKRCAGGCRCRTCGEKAPAPKGAKKAWLEAACTPPPAMPFFPAIRAAGDVKVGRQLLDSSHVLFFHPGTGYHFCAVCGAVARHVARDLQRTCEGTLTRGGSQNLQRLSKGLLPGSAPTAQQANVGRLAAHGGRGRRLSSGRTASSLAPRRAANPPKASGLRKGERNKNMIMI